MGEKGSQDELVYKVVLIKTMGCGDVKTTKATKREGAEPGWQKQQA